MTTQAGYWTVAGGALALAVVAGIFDWLRTRRRNLDDPGWVPWRGLQVCGFFAALVFAVLAMNA
jgi:hypothetical protein